jgi:hypothetical protein
MIGTLVSRTLRCLHTSFLELSPVMETSGSKLYSSAIQKTPVRYTYKLMVCWRSPRVISRHAGLKILVLHSVLSCDSPCTEVGATPNAMPSSELSHTTILLAKSLRAMIIAYDNELQPLAKRSVEIQTFVHHTLILLS